MTDTDPARASQLWQGGDGYYGVDDMENVVSGPAGADGVASSPDFDGFNAKYAVPTAPVGDAAAFHESVQVGGSSGYATPYREFVSETHIPADTVYAVGHAGANPQFGAGGSEQWFRADMKGHNPTPFTAPSSTVDPSLRTAGESVALRQLIHAPWRAIAYTHPLADQ